MVLFVGDDDIDVVGAAEAVVHTGEKTISIRWEVNSYNFRTLVGDNVEESGILMGETIVVLYHRKVNNFLLQKAVERLLSQKKTENYTREKQGSR